MLRLVEQNKDHLTSLDSAIGDADHGLNLLRGFTAVVVALDKRDDVAPGDILLTTGNTLISTVGGAAGPLFGSAFRSAGKALGKEVDVTAAQFAAALHEALAAIQKLGAASVGDKTMVDAFAPAAEAFQAAVDEGAGIPVSAQRAWQAAEDGAVATIPLQALKGRASYLGPRSVGHQDPGATSTALLFRALMTATEGT
ncbi:MAG: phosphoenolpyruvate---glycerone phosphotransferase subunit DhaL [Frankiales bacterium]|jgi:dihydroxyacetone kinase-like protein|nr:phosphoenolpyruvate---glycerone phosphotransferase subunit DhaL [Frankiales bacterium]